MVGTAQQYRRRPTVTPLIMDWFPRPRRPEDVASLTAGAWEARDVFNLLNAADAEEWKGRVGVAGRSEGSAKATTRLLACAGWVAKTCLDHAASSDQLALQQVRRTLEAGAEAGAWHPQKQWFLLYNDGAWYPLSLCPELTTLRRMPTRSTRMAGWRDMLVMAARVHRRGGPGLDLNPSNFGIEDHSGVLYYIDDEFYPALTEQLVAGAMVARIPEEPDASPAEWRTWGRTVVAALSEAGTILGWEPLCDAVAAHPLAGQFHACRDALLDSCREPIVVAARERKAGRARRDASHAPGAPPRTCILADVHGNVVALDAVLTAAAGIGVDSYVFLGDTVGYGPHPAECIARIAGLPACTSVMGNHDHAVGSGEYPAGMHRLARTTAEWTRNHLGGTELAWLASLPPEHIEDGWMAVHGAPRDPHRFLAYVYEMTYEDNLQYLQERGVPLCLYGHTHVQMAYVAEASGPRKVLPSAAPLELGAAACLVNPGSVGQPRDGDPRAAFAVWDRKERRIHFHRVAYDTDAVAQTMIALGFDSELASRLVAGC